MKRLLAIAALTFGALLASTMAPSPAQAQSVTCQNINTGTPQNPGPYPGDNSHFKYCVPGTINNTYVNNVDGAVRGFPTAGYNLLKNDGTTFYLFNNKADEQSYASNPLNGVSFFANNPGRCGYTHNVGGHSYVSLLVTCKLANGTQFPNPNLRRTTLHEAGHAIDYNIMTTQSPNKQPSNSVAFHNLLSQDLNYLDTQPTCTVFQNVAPNQAMENSQSSAPVCTLNGQGQWVKNPIWNGMTNSQILLAQASYLFTGQQLYKEVFAEEVMIMHGGGGSPSILPLSDFVVSRYFHCTRLGVQYYLVTGNPPVPAGTQPGPYPGGGRCTFAPPVADWRQ